ncbi:hypothetical protein K438DRAFT_1863031 [Mycena galopus ATCC 62051]|nr:hypothetical protein K438DRAFT_1863031 [Mycena galopus ATCC 62051]
MDAASPILQSETFVGEMYKTSAILVCYGFYVLLFVIAIFTLSRRQTAGKTLLLEASCTLFLVGTVQTILCIMIATASFQILSALVGPLGSTTEISGLFHMRDGLYAASEAIFAINVFLTDLLFLFRCYLIYARRWRAIIFPAFLIFLTSVAAIVSLGTNSLSTPLGQKVHLGTAVAGYGIGLFANIVLMTLTAGRLWWMSRASAHTHLHTTLKNRYTTTISIILESEYIREEWEWDSPIYASRTFDGEYYQKSGSGTRLFKRVPFSMVFASMRIKQSFLGNGEPIRVYTILV